MVPKSGNGTYIWICVSKFLFGFQGSKTETDANNKYKELLALSLLGQDKPGQHYSNEDNENLHHILEEKPLYSLLCATKGRTW